MQNIRLTALVVLGILAILPASVPVYAQATINLSATRPAVLNDGKDSTDIIAEVRDSSGKLAPDGTTVNFTTTLGQFGSSSAQPTRAGSARIQLRSQQKGTASVMATVLGGTQKLDIVFTDDREETFVGNGYATVQSNNSNIYSAVDRVVEAMGRPRPDPSVGFPGAQLNYRNILIYAEQLQLDCTTNSVKAIGNIVLRCGSKRLNCGRLSYQLSTGNGVAIAEVDNHLRPVRLKGRDMKIEPIVVTDPNAVAIPPGEFEMKDLSKSNLIISSREILVFPGEKLQFKRPRFYQDGQFLVSMPYYSVALYSTQLFSDQFVSVGTNGLGLDLPLYYNMTPGSTGFASIRHGNQTGPGVLSQRTGWSLDLTQQYYSLGGAGRYNGQFGLTGMNRTDWGVRWNHSQEFTADTRGTFFVDFPQHRSMFLSTNLNKQMGAYYIGLNLSGNRNLAGISTNAFTGDFYLETVPKQLGKTGYTYAVGGTTGYSLSQTGDLHNRAMTEGIQTRFFSKPLSLDKSTTITNYLTVGHLWSNQGNSGNTMIASLAANKTFKGANLQLTYDYTKQPLFVAEGGNHRVTANFLASAGTKWNVYLLGSTLLDGPNSSMLGELNYMFAPRWRMLFSATAQKFSTGNYQDFELGLGRNIGGREVVLSYGTFTHRWYFDLQASRF